MFNIFLCDLVLEHEGYCFTNYADDTTPYVVQKNKTGNQKTNNTILVAENLTNFTQKIFVWFASNQIKVYPGKCCQAQKRKQTTNNNKLKFELHIENICQKANRKLNALARWTNYTELPKRRMFINAFLRVNLIIALLFGCFTLVP